MRFRVSPLISRLFSTINNRRQRRYREHSRHHSRQAFFRQPRSEQLESRHLLAAVAWDGGAGTLNWGDANNWSGDVLPAASDAVTINVASAATINVSGSAAINSLDTAHSITLQSGTLAISGTATVQGLFTNAGTVQAWGGGVVQFNNLGRTRDIFSGAPASGNVVTTGDFITSGTALRIFNADFASSVHITGDLGAQVGLGLSIMDGVLNASNTQLVDDMFTGVVGSLGDLRVAGPVTLNPYSSSPIALSSLTVSGSGNHGDRGTSAARRIWKCPGSFTGPTVQSLAAAKSMLGAAGACSSTAPGQQNCSTASN